MSKEEKIDVLDLIINVLIEHERSLDSLLGRLKTLIHQIELRFTEADFLLVNNNMARENKSNIRELTSRVSKIDKNFSNLRKIEMNSFRLKNSIYKKYSTSKEIRTLARER